MFAELSKITKTFYNIQAYLGDIAGSAPDYRNKESHMNFLLSQCV
jgi:hypothetical protein